MKILHLTDLHLEFNLKLQNFYSVVPFKIADVVILTGDIAGGLYAKHFIEHLLSLDYIVIYNLGNHEFYGHDVDTLIQKWKDISNNTKNFYFLENDSVIIEDVEFFGSCLWTSLETKSKEDMVDFFLKLKIKDNEDFRQIKNWSVEKMKDRFYDSFDKIKELIEKSKVNKKVVLTHYLPSYQSVHSNFINNPINSFFATELGNYIAYSDINLWFHGHTHNSFDYIIENNTPEGCNIVCNPYGIHDRNAVNPDFSWLEVIKEI
jgi:Icc-related predicted phosphoesterase